MGKKRLVIAALVVLLLPATCAVFIHRRDRELREIRLLAEQIDGVEVVEVDGYREAPWDTCEYYWLTIRHQNELIHFGSVTPAHFSDVPHLGVGRFGKWSFVIHEFKEGQAAPVEVDYWNPEAEVRCYAYGGGLDFGPDGDVGAKLDPPIRSIPEFLRRLPEVRKVIEDLPDTPPGVRIGSDEYRVVSAAGELETTPTWVWAYKERARH